MKLCPCGYFGAATRACRCSPDIVARYQGRLSGPMLDRIDLQVEVLAVTPEALSAAPDGEPSTAVAQRVARARAVQQERQGGCNAQLSGAALDQHCGVDAAAIRFLHAAAARMGWSARSFHRVLRVARTVADLADERHIGVPHLAEAIQWRRAVPGAGA